MAVLSEAEQARREAEWVGTKCCARCHEAKPKQAFSISKRRRDGLNAYCRACQSVAAKASYRKHREDVLEKQRERSLTRAVSKMTAEQRWRKANPTCPRCKAHPRQVTAIGKTLSYCAACYSEYRVNERAVNPTDARAEDRRSNLARWGLTVEDYDKLLEAQGGVCAICGGTNPGGRRLAIDHDHSCCRSRYKMCGLCIRGLLCSACNTGIGHLGDDPDRLQKAIDYLRSYESLAATA